LKNPERFEFALEKCTELGITNFIVFESSRTVSKADKIDRWNKIVLSAMKQSLRSYLPQISISISLSEIIKQKGEKIIFEQNAKTFFNPEIINPLKNYLFIFGPEGGLSDEEVERINKDYLLKLAENRLRTETAIVKCASILTL
jgi:16S rRNA (uracil1498-N3)-methyltransferase